MTAKGEISKALDGAFHAASILTGSAEVAENAVLDGIAALNFGHIFNDVLLVETVKSAIRRRADLTSRSEQAPSYLPLELQRLFLLAPISRDCFVLQILLGMRPRTYSGILHLKIKEAHEALYVALQALPFLEAGNSIRRDMINPPQTQGSSIICRPNGAERGSSSKGI